MSFEAMPTTSTPSHEVMTPPESREQQKRHEHAVLAKDHEDAVGVFDAQREARAERRAKQFGIVVGCMDERNTFAPEVVGEPLGALEIFSSPGGRVTAETLIKLYGAQLEEARESGKEVVIYLMPHKCTADSHAGCAAFKTDETAQEDYFSKLADQLRGRPEFAGAKIVTAFYDTDSHELSPIAGSEIPQAAAVVQNRLREQMGVASEHEKGSKDRAHSGNRIYVGDRPRAWTARRNVAYHLHSGMEKEELLEGVALAVKVIKGHSHVDLARQPIVIQLDRHPSDAAAIGLTDMELLARLNLSPLLSGIELTSEELLVVRTQTDPESWQGKEEEQTN